jgi:hypothetical protein
MSNEVRIYKRFDRLATIFSRLVAIDTTLDLTTNKRQINAGIVKDLATGIAKTAPKAFVLVISNPVNSTVPIVAEVLKKHGVYDPKRCANTLPSGDTII